jgi:trk system potassium uptake protein TrkH
MEIGGLSFITIAIFFYTMIGAKIGVSNRFLLREALNQSSVSGLFPLVRKIVIITFSVQIICAGINMVVFVKYFDTWWEAFGASLFHSASAFNNARFDIFGGIGSDSLILFKDDILINMTTIAMIILGSCGFDFVMDYLFKKRFKWKKLTLHSKLAISTTIVLIVVGALFGKASITDPNFTWLQALFGPVTCRTAGFTTYDLAELKNYPGAYVIYVILMLIGASPCGTGGGVKTTTIAVVIIAIVFCARGKSARAFGRKISNEQILKAFVLIGMCVLMVVFGTFLVAIVQYDRTLVGTEEEFDIEEILFEVSSAFSTTGLSMGITTSLNAGSSIIICFIMFFGRPGPLTIIGVVNKNWIGNSKEAIQYVEENLIIGCEEQQRKNHL